MEGQRSRRDARKHGQGIPRRVSSVAQGVAAFVEERGGDRPINSVLVANNGLGAVKFMRSVRMWAVRTFGNDKAVTMVAMATPEDIRINAEHLQLADQFVEVPGGTNNNNYANVRLIIQTAERAHVDAVWPGWGHASEDPQLPAALSETERGIRFLGPPSSAMAALGDKVGSTILAQAAGVPTYPWSGKDVQISFRECNGVIPPDVYDRACLQRENARTRCREIGYPVMLKASWGGGGKGIRTVRSDEEVDAILKQVQGEVPGSPIFAMKLASRCRHLEVQLLCDAHGHVCSLYSRDCSLQRRHQKIIEEGPVLNVPPTKLLEMEKSARALARSVGYVGAATVEYLYSLEEESYYFLELNPRLQVEHPVTEGITHVNLPACQLMVGMGIPLHRIPDIRSLYNEDPDGRSVIDFESRARRDPEGHVLAVRITSENANDGFKPTSGNIDELHFRPTSDVWGYFSVKSGGGIHEFSDSQFGHLFAKGATRQEAIRSMLLALKEVKIRGEIRTTVDYIIDMIQEPDFQFQRIHTAWLDNRIAQQIVSERPPWHLALASGAVVKAIDALATRSADYLDLLKKGQIPPSSLSLTQLKEDLVLEGTKYCITLLKQGLHRYRVILNGSALDCVARRQADGGILLQVDGQKHVVYSENEAMGIRLSIDSWTCLLANESDPTQVLAPSAGKIRRYLVEDGAPVRPDEPYAELEVMKMLMQLLAPAAGTVHFQLPEGAVLNCGDLIARLELDDPSTVTRAVMSEDVFAESLGPPQVLTDRIDDRFSLALEAAQEILAGYERDVEVAVTELLQCLDHKDLAFICWAKKFSVAQSRLPTTLKEELQSIMSTYDSSSFDIVPDVVCAEFPAEDLLHAMHKGLEAAAIADRPALEATLQPLIALAEDHRGGKYTTKVVRSLLEEYLNVEERFDAKSTGTTEQDIIYALRHEFNDNLQGVLDLVISHQAQERRSDFVKALLVHVVLPSPADYRPILRRLTAVSSSNANQILKKAQYLLEQSLLADLKGVVARCLTGLELFTGSADLKQQATAVLQEAAPSSGRVARKATQTEGLYKGLGSMTLSQSTKAHLEAQKMAMLVEAPAAVDDALALLLDLPRHEIAEDVESSLDQVTALGIEYRALMTYIKRTYHHCIIQEPRLVTHQQSLVGVWSYEDPFFQGKICHGVMVVLRSLEGLQDCVRFVVKMLNGRTMLQTSGTFHVALTGDDMSAFALFPDASAIVENGRLHGDCSRDLFSQDERVQESLTCVDPNQACRHIQAAIQAITSELQISHFHAVNVVIQTSKLPLRKGFLWHSEAQRFVPQITLRNVESPVAASLELSKLEPLAPHHRPSRNRQWHIYTVNERIGRGASLKRLYLRGALHQIGASPDFVIAASNGIAADVATAVLQELESTLGGCLEELLRVQHGLDYNTTSSVDWAHIFLTLLPPVPLSDDKEADITSALRCGCASWVTRNIDALRRACVTQVEVKIHSSNNARPWRVAMSLPTGHESGEETVDIYREKIEGNDVVLYESQSEPRGALADCPVLAPYDALGFLQQKRLAARRHATTYCYDFPTVFASALREIWHDRAAAGEPDSAVPGGPLAEARELSFEEMDLSVSPYDWKLREIEREPGRNVIGMVAWRMRIKTPEAPDGREIVAVANDITYRSGAFGPQEDALFDAAVKYALTEQLPVVYLAANSGARVGLAMDIREKIKVEWNKEGDPSKGYAYLYLDDADYQALACKRVEGSASQQPLVAQLNEKGHWVLTDVIGHEDGLGVECLSGSGAIAGTFSKAFQQGFTITLVSGRTVGIGAYLARLGRRCVQSNHPIILTGFQALNKLLGREVYTSQLQLGGPRVMGVNGVSHHVVSDDLNGVKTVLKWLSYTPCSLGSFANRLPSSDPIDRPVQYLPGENEKLDPRRAIAGHDTDQGWIAGVFDRGSWMEAQEGWAQTVVTGRARLGGVAVAVIAVETQTVFKTVPADPGMLESSEQQIPQAGQVWFPDSALKTAQALEEFNLEHLPLVILANWRGFSGGQRDLFEGVLQSGALIVENLRTYHQPVFVYLPPSCELRGGAWAVIDSKINGAMVEMYADPGARGGVLEPEGVVEIKFKKADLVKMMHRLDPELQSLTQANADRGTVHKREQMLLPVYHQVALHFAEMHDTPNRMKAKGVIRDIVPWRHARSFLAQRLRRRLAEETTIKQITTSDPSVSRSAAAQLIKTWFLDALQRQQQQGSAHPEDKWQEDAFVHDWMMSSTGKAKIESALKDLQKSSARHRVQALLGSPEGTQGLLEALKSRVEIDSGFKAQVNAALRDFE